MNSEKLNMNHVLTLHNVRIPTSACVDLAKPERTPASVTPSILINGLSYFPVLNGDETPVLLSAIDIANLDGEVPMAADIFLGVEGREVWLGKRCWKLRLEGFPHFVEVV